MQRPSFVMLCLCVFYAAADSPTDPYGVMPQLSDFRNVGDVRNATKICGEGYAAGTCIALAAKTAVASYTAAVQRNPKSVTGNIFGTGKRWAKYERDHMEEIKTQDDVERLKTEKVSAEDDFKSKHQNLLRKQAKVSQSKADLTRSRSSLSESQNSLTEAEKAEKEAQTTLDSATEAHKYGHSWKCRMFGNWAKCPSLEDVKKDLEHATDAKNDAQQSAEDARAAVTADEVEVKTAVTVQTSAELEVSVATTDLADAENALKAVSTEVAEASSGADAAMQAAKDSLAYFSGAAEEVCLVVTAGGCSVLLTGMFIFGTGASELYASYRDMHQVFNDVTRAMDDLEKCFMDLVGKMASSPAVIGDHTKDWLVISLALQSDRAKSMADKITTAIKDIGRNNDDVDTSWYCYLFGWGCLRVPDAALQDLRSAEDKVQSWQEVIDEANACVMAHIPCHNSTMQRLLDKKAHIMVHVCSMLKAAGCKVADVAKDGRLEKSYCDASCIISNHSAGSLFVTLVEPPKMSKQVRCTDRTTIAMAFAAAAAAMGFLAAIANNSRHRSRDDSKQKLSATLLS